MPVRPLSRSDMWLMPPSLDELIPQNHPARFVAAFVDALDRVAWDELGISVDGEPRGAPEYHPRGLLSVWLYGFMTRTRSSRKLEAACRDQIPYLWLTGWQHPDHNTLWRFYHDHRDCMRTLFKRTVQTAIKLDLADLAVQAVDGTKIAGNASRNRTYDARQLAGLLERTEKTISELEKENEEGSDPPPVNLPEKLAEAQRLHEQVTAAMKELAEDGKKRINLTDGDAGLMKGGRGMVVGFNAQAMVSPVKIDKDASLMITAADVSTCAGDPGNLIPMLEQSEENTGRRAAVSLADASYHSGPNLEACVERKQVIVMPEPHQGALESPYHKDYFKHDKDADTYTCPRGKVLHFQGMKKTRGTLARQYRASASVCRQCPAFGTCTKNAHGRTMEIGPNDTLLRQHRAWMATHEAKQTYRRRKELPEPTFGILKEQMGMRQFLLRGLSNVKAEWITAVTAFNLRSLWRCWLKGKLQDLRLVALQKASACSSPIPDLPRLCWP